MLEPQSPARARSHLPASLTILRPINKSSHSPPISGPTSTASPKTSIPSAKEPSTPVSLSTISATYSTTFTAPPSHISTHYLLHFDDVRDLAAIKINGKSAGLIWAPPYDVDITAALHPGINTLEVSVTNEWSNRIAADRSLPADQRILHDVPPAFPGAPPAPLQPSGLSGEVSIVAVTPARK